VCVPRSDRSEALARTVHARTRFAGHKLTAPPVPPLVLLARLIPLAAVPTSTFLAGLGELRFLCGINWHRHRRSRGRISKIPNASGSMADGKRPDCVGPRPGGPSEPPRRHRRHRVRRVVARGGVSRRVRGRVAVPVRPIWAGRVKGDKCLSACRDVISCSFPPSSRRWTDCPRRLGGSSSMGTARSQLPGGRPAPPPCLVRVTVDARFLNMPPLSRFAR
jgi:hypothetical protein